MQTRQELIDTMSDNELALAVANRTYLMMKEECDNDGRDFDELDVNDAYELIDSHTQLVQIHLESLLPSYT